MKPMAATVFLLILLASASLTQAQGFRGGFAGGGRSGGGAPAQSGAVMTGRPGPAGSQGFNPSQSRFVNPPIGIQNVPSLAAPRFGPGQFQRGHNVFAPTPFGRRTPGFILGIVPFHRHRPWFFHRHPGIVFYDVPGYFDTTIVTPYAPYFPYVPGTPQPDRRYADNAPGNERTRGPGQVAPFDPAPQEVVQRMLVLAGVKKDDVVYDLGSGDGRILIAAAKKYGVRAVGFEIDPGLVKLARENARREGVEKLVEIREQDFLTANLSPASVVTLYLSYDGNLSVRPQLLQQLKPGARVVSYVFDMGDWQPKIAETYRDAAGDSHPLYLWRIGEPMVFSDNSPEILQPQPTRDAPLIIEVR
jgi:SAM-dependent methyltransferase